MQGVRPQVWAGGDQGACEARRPVAGREGQGTERASPDRRLPGNPRPSLRQGGPASHRRGWRRTDPDPRISSPASTARPAAFRTPHEPGEFCKAPKWGSNANRKDDLRTMAEPIFSPRMAAMLRNGQMGMPILPPPSARRGPGCGWPPPGRASQVHAADADDGGCRASAAALAAGSAHGAAPSTTGRRWRALGRCLRLCQASSLRGSVASTGSRNGRPPALQPGRSRAKRRSISRSRGVIWRSLAARRYRWR